MLIIFALTLYYYLLITFCLIILQSYSLLFKVLNLLCHVPFLFLVDFDMQITSTCCWLNFNFDKLYSLDPLYRSVPDNNIQDGSLIIITCFMQIMSSVCRSITFADDGLYVSHSSTTTYLSPEPCVFLCVYYHNMLQICVSLSC